MTHHRANQMLRCEICKHKVSDYFYLEEHMNHFHDNNIGEEYKARSKRLDEVGCLGLTCSKVIICATCVTEFKCYTGRENSYVEELEHKEVCGRCI